MIPYPGEIAALAAASCWAVSAVAFEVAGKRVGSLSVNVARLVLALFILFGWLAVVRGNPLPTDLPPRTLWWLAGSGVVGFALGDLCLFRAIVTLGARVALLIMALVPPITALLSLLILGEGLTTWGLVGMTATVAGVVLVVMERTPGSARKYPWTGVLLALGGAVGQAGGLLMSRHVMEGVYPFSASLVRIVGGLVGFVVVLTVARWWTRVGDVTRDRRALGTTFLGAVFGPFLGVSASLAAVRYTDAGTASTLMAIVPVLLIVPTIVIFKEKVSARSVFGAVLAVVGVACMFR